MLTLLTSRHYFVTSFRKELLLSLMYHIVHTILQENQKSESSSQPNTLMHKIPSRI